MQSIEKIIFIFGYNKSASDSEAVYAPMSTKKEVTIYDIAKTLRLSASTVSRGLRDHPAIRSETIKRIKETAHSMGYQQNPFASNLRSNRSNTIGVILPRLDSNFQSAVVAGIEKCVNQNGYNLIISQSRESMERERASVTTMYNSRVDGILVSLACDTCNLRHFDNLLRKGIPVVLFDRVKEHPGYPCSKVIIDNEKAGKDATEHLIGQGCRRIMFVGDNLTSNVYEDRHQGYLQALRGNHLREEPELTFITTLDEDSGERVLDHFMRMKEKPDGIFAANDTSAVSIICQLKRKGIRIPEEVAIVGFNDVHIARIIDPPLSTILYPGEEMGEIAASTLIEILGNPGGILNRTVVLDHQLIIRGSSLRSSVS
jgi:LacI family transcriptional regulator